MIPPFSKADPLTSKFKPGKYCITDPCYVFPNEMWQDLCTNIFCSSDGEQGIIEMDGYLIWWGGTANGDGTFAVYQSENSIGTFSVDAGLFALIPYEFAEKYAPDFLSKGYLYTIIENAKGTPIFSNGNMTCGNISVITDGSDEENEEDCDDDDQ